MTPRTVRRVSGRPRDFLDGTTRALSRRKRLIVSLRASPASSAHAAALASTVLSLVRGDDSLTVILKRCKLTGTLSRIGSRVIRRRSLVEDESKEVGVTNTELAELLLVRLYDLAETEGYLKYHRLNEIAAEFGVSDKEKVFNLGKALERRGQIYATFTMGPAVSAAITGEGSLFVESGGSTGVIRNYREQPQSFNVAIDQSTHFHAAITGSNIAAHSSNLTQRLEPPPEIRPLLAAIEAAISSTADIDERRREEALNDVTVLNHELTREKPRKPVVDTILATLGKLSSLTSLLMQLQPLLEKLPWLSG